MVVLAGCSEQVGGTAVSAPDTASPSGSTSAESPAPSSQADPSAPASSVDLSVLPGTWRGSYFCAQGETGMELKIAEPVNGQVEAVFSFFPAEGGPPIESGSFRMLGSEQNGTLVFRQQEWIEQPQGYVMVDLGVATVGNDTMTGRVAGSGCGDFSVTKQPS